MEGLLLCDNGEWERVAALARRHALGMEAQAFYDPSLLDKNPRAMEKHRTAMAGIKLRAVHGPFGDLNPGSFDPMVRAVARHRFEMGYRAAEGLGAQHLIFHLGYVPRTSPIGPWVARCSDFWQDFLDGHRPGMAIHLENMLEQDPEILRDVVASIGHPAVDACLDTGHVHANARGPVVRWIEVLGDAIGYVHLHDNHGEEDEHLGLGAGNLPVQEVCAALEAYAPGALWALEAEGRGLELSLAWLREHGFAAES
jgi:sugar phosphate isomerase/epimerase